MVGTIIEETVTVTFERRSPARDSERAGSCFERVIESGLEKRLGREMASRRSMRKEIVMRSVREKRVKEDGNGKNEQDYVGPASYTGNVSKFRAYDEVGGHPGDI